MCDLKCQDVTFELDLEWSRELLKGFEQGMSSGKARLRENVKTEVEEVR